MLSEGKNPIGMVTCMLGKKPQTLYHGLAQKQV